MSRQNVCRIRAMLSALEDRVSATLRFADSRVELETTNELLEYLDDILDYLNVLLKKNS